MAIQSNFPAIKPTLLLDFANTEQLDPRITFTRASTGTYYDGKTVAKAEENLFLRSQEFENSSWAKARTTVTANAIAAPDGTTSSDAIYETVDTNTHYINQAITPNGQAYTISVFAKSGLGRDWLWIRTIASGPAERTAFFDITNGVVGNVGAGLTASITSVGGGWYRCIVTTTNSATTQDAWGFGPSSANGTNNYTGDITKGIYVWGAQLEQRSAVTAYIATTTQPITNYIPQLLTAASGVARFEHNPTTGESLGLEIEESRTNLVTYSEQFDNAAWGKFNATVTANTVVAPDGALTGDKLFENSASGVEHYIEQTISTTTNQAYTQSVYVKAAETASFRMVVVAVGSLTATVSDAIFTISSGVISYSSGSGLISYGSATHVGNGWYRCTVTYTLNGTVTSHRMRIYPRISGIYTGNGFSGIYIWGAQLEAGAFATSYIPTVASQVTRAADAASMTGTNFSSWYNQAEGTLFAEAAAPLWSANAVASAPALASINDGAANNRIYLGRSAASTRPFFNVGVAGVTQADITTSLTSWAGGSAMKLAGAYKVNDFAICTDGGAAGTDTVGTLPVVTQLLIGSRGDGPIWNSTIKKLAYYPALVTNAQSQALTS